MAKAVKVASKQAVIGRQQVKIRNAELATALVQNPKSALSLLRDVAPVNIKDISIDAVGRVVVNNPGFAGALRDLRSEFKDGGKAFNIICGLSC